MVIIKKQAVHTVYIDKSVIACIINLMKIPNDCFVHAVINKKIINGNKRDAINNIQKEFYEYCVSHGFPDEFKDEFES